MLSLPGTIRIFAALDPVDMRKSFDALRAVVETQIQQDPFSGHLFLFRNRRRDHLKLLWWDRDGFTIYYRRLERGVFQWPSDLAERAVPEQTKQIVIDADELLLLLRGIELSSVKRRRRYARPEPQPV
jgi:transposase